VKQQLLQVRQSLQIKAPSAPKPHNVSSAAARGRNPQVCRRLFQIRSPSPPPHQLAHRESRPPPP
jgi:hypothetical protein